MQLEIQETATASLTATDYKRALKSEQREWTIQNLGIELEQAPKKSSRKVKKQQSRLESP